jgi:hypothetical protein
MEASQIHEASHAEEQATYAADVVMKEVEEEKEGSDVEGTTGKVRDNLDVMAMVVAYLNRKVKFKLQGLSKDFRSHVVPRTMVSLAFKGHDCLTESTLFQHCITSCKKVERLLIDSVDIDLAYVNILHSTLLKNKELGVEKFLSRVKHLTLSKITFLEGQTEA